VLQTEGLQKPSRNTRDRKGACKLSGSCPETKEVDALAYSVERRKLPRIEVRWPVTIYTDGGPIRGEARNVTTTGAYILCRERLRQNETYRILIGLAKHSITVSAEVMWSNIDYNDGETAHTGLGVFFARMDEEDRERLGEAIAGYRHY